MKLRGQRRNEKTKMTQPKMKTVSNHPLRDKNKGKKAGKKGGQRQMQMYDSSQKLWRQAGICNIRVKETKKLSFNWRL